MVIKVIEVLTKAAAFICIIIMGYVLKKCGVFKKDDFYILSKIVIRITLPAAIVSNFSKISMDNSLLIMCLIGIILNLILIALGYLMNLKKSGDDKAFDMINISGYNIGNFTLPFVQSFLGPIGFATTSLFDAGNAIMCTGATYTLASAVKGTGEKFSVKKTLASLFSSIPFDAYVVMTILAILKIKLPEIILSFASTVGSANAFLALFMIGIGFEIHMEEKDKMFKMIKIIVVRYGTALIIAAIAYFLTPFSLEIRQALVILSFGPISSVSPAFTGKIGGDIELASAINSLSIVTSIIAITIALIVIL